MAVARRCLADQWRANSRRAALEARMVVAGEGQSVTPDPADEVVARNGALVALAQLSDTDRELLCLVAWDGLSAAEAAEALGCSVAAAKVRLHRARRRFEAALSGDSQASESTSVVRLATQLHPLLPKEVSR
jgi:RNA polymerase sigma-70 factor (ECF subfamily)